MMAKKPDNVVAMAEQLPPPANETSPAISDWRISRSTTAERQLVPSLDSLAGKRGLVVYEEMATTDACVRSCLALLRASVIGSGWRLEPGDDSDAAREAADVITGDLLALPGSFEEALSEMLSALTYGFACLYKVWSLEGRISIAKLQALHPASIEFSTKPDGSLVFISQQTVGGVELDPRRVMHFVHDGHFGNPRGWSLLRAAWKPYFHKLNVSQWLAQWMERLSNPPVLVRHPVHTQEVAVTKMLSVADRMAARTSVSLPEGFSLELLESTRDPRSQFVTVLEHLSQEIARALLVHDLSGFSGGKVEGGSYALGLSQERMFLLLIEGIRRNLEACISEQLLKDCAVYAFGIGTPAPRFRLLPVQEENKLGIVAAFNSLVQSGALQATPGDAAHVRQLLGFPEEQSGQTEQFSEMAGGGAREGVPYNIAAPSSAHHARGKAHRTARRHTGSSVAAPSLFGEREPLAPWRPLTHAEQRTDVLKLAETTDQQARDFAVTMAEGAAEIVSDLRGQVERMGDVVDPATVANLRASPAVIEKLRQKLETQLVAAYETGARSAIDEIERSTEESPDAV